jgi:hypothetical protein
MTFVVRMLKSDRAFEAGMGTPLPRKSSTTSVPEVISYLGCTDVMLRFRGFPDITSTAKGCI